VTLEAQTARIVDLLPAAMVDDDFTIRFVGIFDQLQSDIAAGVAGATAYFDPSTTPTDFLRLLALWINLPIPATWEDADRTDGSEIRQYLTDAAPLFRWRGTRRGLETLLRSATRCPVSVADPGGVWVEGAGDEVGELGPVRVEIDGPVSLISRADIDTLVRAEIPVGVRFEVVVHESSDIDA
jgi:phage tail-like protein